MESRHGGDRLIARNAQQRLHLQGGDMDRGVPSCTTGGGIAVEADAVDWLSSWEFIPGYIGDGERCKMTCGGEEYRLVSSNSGARRPPLRRER